MNEELENQPSPEEEEPFAAEPFAQLRRVDNTGPTEELFHVAATCLIGRHDPAVADVDVDLSDLPDAKFVSRRHASLEYEEGVWYLTDHGSSNGTYLYRQGETNFLKVSDRVAVANGDEIVFGNLRFRFETPEATEDQAD